MSQLRPLMKPQFEPLSHTARSPHMGNPPPSTVSRSEGVGGYAKTVPASVSGSSPASLSPFDLGGFYSEMHSMHEREREVREREAALPQKEADLVERERALDERESELMRQARSVISESEDVLDRKQ
ncbi:hypothetical protein KIPB_006711, partial [Kipferlia bialata]|eukprot:g6711.t1